MISAMDFGCGFNTAGGKSMAIGEKAMDKARSLFFDLDQVENDDAGNSFSKNPCNGFNTGGGKSMIVVGEKAMEKARTLFMDLDKSENGDAGNSFVGKNPSNGFNTAGGKSLGVGEKAMEKGRSFFSDLEKEAFSDFKTPDAPAQKESKPQKSTPRLPAASRFSTGRRRLADIPPQSSSSEKKQRKGILNRIDSSDDESKSAPASFSLPPSPLLTKLPQRRSFFQYSTPRPTTSPLFASASSITTNSDFGDSPAETTAQSSTSASRVELDEADRSTLMRILNQDDTTYRPMVLRVSSVIAQKDCDAVVELTDGWHRIKARLDISLSQKLSNGRMVVDQKLFISRCSIVGLEAACDPSEAPEDVQLVLSINNVRPAKPHAVVGFQNLKAVPCFSLDSLVPNGGTVAGVEVVVRRIYPMMYMVKTANGTMVMDEKAEAKEARAFEVIYERCLEKLVEEINNEFANNGSMPNGTQGKAPTKSRVIQRIPTTQELRRIRDVEELYQLFIRVADPSAFAARTTDSQQQRLKSFCYKIKEQEESEVNQKFEDAVKAKASLLPQRKVIPFLKMDVAGLHAKDIAKNVTSVLTIWRPDEDAIYHVKKGAAYVLTGLQVTRPSSSPGFAKFGLSTTSETRFISLANKN